MSIFKAGLKNFNSEGGHDLMIMAHMIIRSWPPSLLKFLGQSRLFP